MIRGHGAVRKISMARDAEKRERRRKSRMEGGLSQPSEASRPSDEPAQREPTQEENPPDLGNPNSPPSSPVGRMATRAIAMGRRIDFNFFESYSFSIGTWIERMGWKNFCSMDIPMYPKLVREFYENLRTGYPVIVSTVKGVQVTVSEESLSQIFGITKDGFVPDKLSDKKLGLRLIVGREDIVGDVLAPTLSVEMRVLHHIISGIFIPKLGRHDFVSERELCMMYLIVEGTQINLPGIMMHQMREAASKNKVCLPYGMALTKVFETAGVSFENEASKKQSFYDVYDMKALTRMQYHVEDGRWVKNVSGQERRAPRAAEAGEPSTPVAARDAPDTDPETPTTSRAPPPRRFPQTAPADSESLERLADMISAKVGSEIHGLSERVEAVQTEMRTISHRLLALEQREHVHGTSTDSSSIIEELAQLKEKFISGNTELKAVVENLSQAQQQGITSVLGAMGSLIGKIERLAPGAIPAAAAADAAARAAVPRPPPPSPMSPGHSTQVSTSVSRPPLRVYTRGGAAPSQAAGPSARTRSRRATQQTSSQTLEIPSDED